MAIFPYFMLWKCPYIGGWVVQKSLKTPLRNIKMAPYLVTYGFQNHKRSAWGFQGVKDNVLLLQWIRGRTKEVLFFVSEKILFLNRRKKFWLEFLQDSITIMVQMINVLWYSTLYLSIINGYLMSLQEIMSPELHSNVTLEVQIHKSSYFSTLLFMHFWICMIRNIE